MLKLIAKKSLRRTLRWIKLRRQKIVAHTIVSKANRINLCCGSRKLPDFCNIDISTDADLVLDLEKTLLPFRDNQCEIVICISAINYFSRQRGLQIIKDAHRILEPGGVARFATQDLRLIAQKYIKYDKDFFFQKLVSGKDRFEGETIGDKFNSWFYGYKTSGGKYCKYFYDFESLALLFKKAGFTMVEKKDI